MKKRIIYWMLMGVLALSAGCSGKREVLVAGKTMGTTYHVKIITTDQRHVREMTEKIEARLKQINRSMSIFIPDSEISRFNRLDKVGEKFPVSEDFYQVMLRAATLHQWTQGAWDGTVMPLVNLWGFGSRGMTTGPPGPDAIRAAKERVGFDHIIIGDDRSLAKTHASVSLDLASIAKGYGVDALSRLIRENGFSNFLVEIGGEVYAAGLRKDGKPWRVGINRPASDAAPNEVYRAISLEGRALATSGDYRNFFELEGVRYSHVLDPATGYPVSNGVVSASVLADTCTLADGLATALMVLGPDKGLALVNRLSGIECLIVVRAPGGALTDHLSRGFQQEE